MKFPAFIILTFLILAAPVQAEQLEVDSAGRDAHKALKENFYKLLTVKGLGDKLPGTDQETAQT